MVQLLREKHRVLTVTHDAEKRLISFQQGWCDSRSRTSAPRRWGAQIASG